jgi:hypothetical protein
MKADTIQCHVLSTTELCRTTVLVGVNREKQRIHVLEGGGGGSRCYILFLEGLVSVQSRPHFFLSS